MDSYVGVSSDTDQTPPGLGIAALFLVFLLFYALFAVAHLPTVAVERMLGVELSGVRAALLQLVLVWPIYLWLSARWAGTQFRRLIGTNHPSLLLLIGIGFLAVPATVPILLIAGQIPVPEAMQERLSSALDDRAALLVAMILVAPIAEELFFRGVVLQSLLRRGSVKRAIWLSAGIFAVFHLNPWQAVIALPAGLFFGWLTVRTGSIIPAVVGHMSVNATPHLIMPEVLTLFGYGSQVETIEHIPLRVAVLGVAGGCVGGYMIWAQLKRHSPSPLSAAARRAAPSHDH